MDDDARAYIDAIAPGQRPLFDRFHGLVLAEFPDAADVSDPESRAFIRGALQPR